MVIEWNKVTWYSKIVAVVVFVGTFFLGFWLGTMKEGTIYVEVPGKVAQNVSPVNVSITTLEIADITTKPEIYEGKSLFVHGELYCDDVSPYFQVVDFLSLPNPEGDPLPYLEVYVVENGRYTPLTCGDTRYQRLVTGGYNKEKGVTIKGIFFQRRETNAEQFVNLYSTLPSPGIGDKEVYNYRGADYFVLED